MNRESHGFVSGVVVSSVKGEKRTSFYFYFGKSRRNMTLADVERLPSEAHTTSA